MPEMLRHVWEYFIDLCQTRTSNGFGANPISYLEVKAWSDLVNINLDSTEISIIKLLDKLYLDHQAKKKESEQ